MDGAPLDHELADHELPSPQITSEQPGSYPWTVLHDRHPALLRQVLQALPYPPARREAIEALGREITGAIEPLTDAGPDARVWSGWAVGQIGQSWYQPPFLWAENYFYRKLLAATGYLEPGPWQGVDPFGPAKDGELADPRVDAELAALEALPDLPVPERTDALVLAALWGNQADLGFLLNSGGTSGESSTVTPADRADRLVADDREALWQMLAGEPGVVVLVADNAGRELLPDLVLIDHLLTTGQAGQVVLHVKSRPYFVSDATTGDLLSALTRLRRGPVAVARQIGERLWTAIEQDRLAIRADPFFVTPLTYHQAPAGLQADFARAKLTILKGDLNYRRLVADRHWPATTSFAELTSYFPGPVVALRTLKSDVVVGLAQPTRTALDSTGTPWRTTGTHALIQARR